MKKSFLQYIIVSLIIFAFTGCQDDFMKEETIGEGKAMVSATLDFKPMSSALTRTRAAGDVLKDISSLHVLLYDYDTKILKKSWKVEGYTVSDEDREYTDAENKHSAEEKTKRATFKLPERIDFGRYYMYAVANIPDLLTEYSDDIQTVDGLKNITLVWDSEDMAANGQMIGCLMTRAATLPIDDEPLILNENSTKLHAWLRRVASKVTVAFDGSSLKEGVSIYLKAFRIKKIPTSCKLGADNTVTDSKKLQAGEEVIYCDSKNYDANYPALVTRNLPYPRVQKTGEDGTMSWVMDPDAHSETNPNSLFFYENMQGEGPDKRQSDEINHDGILDELYPYDKKQYATYIEVDAYYESTNPERPGICNITYRFMLGQNVTTDYDAKRNSHYKLTLHFNGFADEPDWRIDYVTRLWATEPKTVDYRGKYFVPDNVNSNHGNNFSGNNIITVTSFMYQRDSWIDRTPVDYRIEYKDAGNAEFTETRPDWLDEFEETHKGNGVFELKIKYKNTYTPQKINTTLSNNPSKAGIYDLATKGGSQSMSTANCYIVDSKGTYKFPLVYGNAITEGNENVDSYTYKGWGDGINYLKTFRNYKGNSIRSPYILDDIYGSTNNVPNGLSASLVWQDEKNLITDIQYDKTAYTHGGIRFTVGNDIKEGNAVIALKDPSGIIIWSWHIWVTAIDLSRKITLTNAKTYGNRKFEIMPVNLGWCSGDIPVRYYDRHECEVRFTQLISGDGQEGLSKTVKIIQEPHIALPRGNNPYFQWGRKDPFIAGGNADKTTKTWYTATETKTSAPALMYATVADRVKTYQATSALIKNPDKWQNCPHQEPGDWGNPYKPDDIIFFNLWDNSCWDDNDDVIKTIYDPCPAGYHVSSVYTFSGFTDYGGSITDGENGVDIRTRMYAATEENMMPESDYKTGIFEFYTNETKLISIGFPQNGYRDWDDNAKLWQYNGYGEVWCAQAVPFDWSPKYMAYHLEFARYHHIFPWNNFYATDGFPVRPSITLP